MPLLLPEIIYAFSWNSLQEESYFTIFKTTGLMNNKSKFIFVKYYVQWRIYI